MPGRITLALSLAIVSGTHSTFSPAAAQGASRWRQSQDCCAIVELRQYTLHPGQRDVLIDLFDREFVETQEAVGMTVIGQFRDLDRPDVFTWLRGFPDMESRAKSLSAFYDGPVWKEHRDAANRTMIDSDNVRLLRPDGPHAGFPLTRREPKDSDVRPTGLLVATIYTLLPDSAATFAEFFDRDVVPLLSATGAKPVARFVTEPSPNTFPRLPVREGENVFVWFATFEDAAAFDRHEHRLASDARWTTDVEPSLATRLARPADVWRLSPTSRSRAFR